MFIEKKNEIKLLIMKKIIIILLIFCINVRATNFLPREFQNINADNWNKQLFNYARLNDQRALMASLNQQQELQEQQRQLPDIPRAIRRPFRMNEMTVARGFGKRNNVDKNENDFKTPIKVYIVENESNLLKFLLPKVDHLNNDN